MNKENLLLAVNSLEELEYDGQYFSTLKEMLYSAIEENEKGVLEMILRKSYDDTFFNIAKQALKIMN
ncbi:hypothetical protein CHCC14600_4260 [Bacillus licheniformis]|uniref:hypothetical protein n=1 Tax=Bacillus TaxID=1386 RepID=UPI0009B7E270|nr:MULTISPECIES: hypothetical protein [Bacillus]ARC72525.1 hypothetical protein B37_00472 [Bacillus licheniformis]ARW41657.1 hypothetical protein S100141_00334 [Bacillus licheniformis]ARW56510.1 hypothetical protein S100027_04546 [Bacillus licheniformis]AXF87781.1 hypothetical protein BLDA23_05640 [Bacillus licheniformis]MCA1182423.1 hypothetical protein [Bacillus licheniformis]